MLLPVNFSASPALCLLLFVFTQTYYACNYPESLSPHSTNKLAKPQDLSGSAGLNLHVQVESALPWLWCSVRLNMRTKQSNKVVRLEEKKLFPSKTTSVGRGSASPEEKCCCHSFYKLQLQTLLCLCGHDDITMNRWRSLLPQTEVFAIWI